MSYLSHAQNPRHQIRGLAGTIAINATIGILVVTGLKFTGTVNPRRFIPTFDVPTPPPPPSPQPAPSTPAAAEQPLVVPPPPRPLPPTPGPTLDASDRPLDNDFTTVLPRNDPSPAITPTLRPAPSFTPKGARPSNNAARWITTDDYPRRSLMDQNEGTARYRLVIGTNGKVSSCEVTTSTGDAQLDEATCKFITRRAQFEPATDENGAKVLGTYTGTVRWDIPD